MKARALGKAMREQRRQLRRQLAESKARFRAELRASPRFQERARRRRRRSLTTLMMALLLLLFIDRCECGPAPLPPPAPKPAPPDAGVARAAFPRLDAGFVAPSHRAKFGLEEPAPPVWLDEFRLQVAARSTKLADCFRGVNRPGALRWSTGVNVKSGQVSDHALEPVGEAPGLDATRRECLIHALSEPTYRLDPKGIPPPSTPVRVSIVLEF